MSKRSSSFETEEALLGLLLKENKLILEVEPILELDDFTDAKTISVYQALINLKSKFSEENNFINDIEIAEEAKNFFKTQLTLQKGVFYNEFSASEAKSWSTKDWHDYLSILVYSSGFKTHLNEYLQTLQEKKRLRNFYKLLFGRMNEIEGSTTKSIDIIADLQKDLNQLTKDINVKDFIDVKTFTEDFHNKLINQVLRTSSIKTEIRTLDNVINGFNKGDLVILAARPSMGKTAFALELARKISANSNVGFFSIEMPNEQLVQRLIASRSNVFLNKIKNYASLTSAQKSAIEISMELISSYKLWLDDTPGLRLNELIWKARKLHSVVKLDIIFIDYLQLIESSTRGENRHQEVSEISRSLKALARELEIPIVALSQLSRRVEQREDKRPIMSDIRESGSIEQDADLIMFLYRDNYYKQKKDQHEGNLKEDVEIIISKHRNGPTGIVTLLFDPSIGTFEDKQ